MYDLKVPIRKRQEIMAVSYSFPGITLLITHYNRSSSLERLLATFRRLNCTFAEIIVSDDASRPEHLDNVKAMQHEYNFRLVTTPINRGHGNSINKGQDLVTTPYTIYVQEDFVPSDIFPEHLADAFQFMEKDETLDYIRFWALADSYPDLKPYGKGFSEMQYKLTTLNHLKFYQYSDTPHLRRSNFFERFGRYKEGLKGDVIDYRMAISFLQNKGKGLFYNNYNSLFAHENSEDEPSMMRELINWRQRRNLFTRPLRWAYLKYKWIKCTLDVRFMH
ncbi:MAG: glycosyl transferase family 2 [Flavipsychrobacter sp.]|nr:glycosyl transferase family 2 [Flavipsychrobacter sp.]